ncbi:MAG: NifB/NifX family molybdenum-iron cluster-binding protein [Planctomycetota bacterium]|nr:NifB/NifX family molybdenum-iron cluster-binding protein [Planctomycetota bacterium]
MKITVTATGPDIGAAVDPRFGRCPYFLIVDTDTMKFEAVENPNLSLGGGAGIQSAQLMAGKGVQFVLTGNCGPNAYQTLSAAGIEVIIGCSGTAADVVEQFKAGQLNATGQPNVASKFGAAGAPGAVPDQPAGSQPPPMAGGGMGMGRGMGQGGGGGMGRGGGRGMGRGQGMGAAFGQGPAPMPQQPAQNLTKDDELATLKQQAKAMAQQMQQIQQRIQDIEQEKTNG